MSVVKRIKQYLDFKGITNQNFEKSVGYSNGAFGSQLKNNKNIGSDKLENILKVYKDINGSWLLTGKGEMLSSSMILQEPGDTYKKEGTHLKGILFEDQTIIEKKLNEILKKIDDLYEINTDVAEIKKTVERLAVLDEIDDEIEKNGH